MEPVQTSVVVDCGDGMKVRLRFDGPTTVFQVKQALLEDFGIETIRQSLSYGYEDLPGNERIDGGVSVLFLTVYPLPEGTKLRIRVRGGYPRHAGYQEEFVVEETDTVMELKKKILGSRRFVAMLAEKVTHVAPEEVLAEDLDLRRNQDWVMTGDESPLSKYYVHEGCSIDVLVHAVDRKADPDGEEEEEEEEEDSR